MKKILLFFIILISLNGNDDYYNTLCIEEQSTGFNWKKGKWIKTNFISEKYLIKKIKPIKAKNPKDNLSPEAICYNLGSIKNLYNSDKVKFKSSCYNIKNFKAKDNIFNTKLCTELWLKNTNNFELINVECENFYFSPNGWFHKSHLTMDLNNKPKNDYKDSMTISIGHCSKL